MPLVKLTNQKPIDYSQFKILPTDFNVNQETSIEKQVAKPFANAVFSPLTSTSNVTLKIDNKITTIDDLKEIITEELNTDDVNVHDNEINSLVIHQSSRYRNNQPEDWKHILANTYLLKQNAQIPSPTLIYTYDTDIQNQAKDVLTNPTDQNKELLLTGLIGNLLPKPLNNKWVFILTNKNDYQQFQDELMNNIINNTKNAETIKFGRQASQIKLDTNNVFTSWITGNNNQSQSFNRFALSTLSQFKGNSWTKVLPLNVQALISPIGFSFIDINKLSNSTNKAYKAELNKLKNVTNRLVKFRITNLNNLKSANTITNNQTYNNHKQYVKNSQQLSKRYHRGFKKTLPSANWQIKVITKIIKHHISKNKSQNSYRTNRYTFMRPNRRHPNNMNLKGHFQNLSYRPDIHIYLDSSGSISEPQYKTAVMLLIKLAKKLNVNLYFSSFADRVAQPYQLNVKNHNAGQIYQEFRKIPKVDGGTEYEQVWQMIDLIDLQNKKAHLAPRLNFMITDFDYDLRSEFSPRLNQASTKDTYYLPIATNKSEYAMIVNYANEFANELIDKNDFKIRSRMIM